MAVYVAHFGSINLPEGEGRLIGQFGSLTTPAAPTGLTLEVFDAVHLHDADAIPLSQAHAVNVEDSEHVQASDFTSFDVPEEVPEPFWPVRTEWLIRPELRQKRRKPVGPTRIDWSNPLSKGLVACYLFGDKRNAVNGGEGTLANGALLERDGLQLDDAGATYQSLDIDSRSTTDMTFGGEQFLIVFRARLTSTTYNEPSLISTSANGGSDFGNFEIYYDVAAKSLKWLGNSISDNASGDGDVLDGEFHTFAAYRVGTTLYVSIDGAPPTNPQLLSGLYISLIAPKIGGAGFIADPWDGTIESFFLWRNIDNPEQLYQAIVEDPYQFLKPALKPDYLFFPEVVPEAPFYYPTHLGRRYDKPTYPVEPNRYSPIQPNAVMLLTERGPYGLKDAITEQDAEFYNEGAGSDHWEFDRRKFVDGVKFTGVGGSYGTTIYYRAIPGLQKDTAPYECTVQCMFIAPDTGASFEAVIGLTQPGQDSTTMSILVNGTSIVLYNEDTSLVASQVTIPNIIQTARIGDTFVVVATKKGDEVALYVRDMDTGETWSKIDDISSLGTQYALVFNIGGLYLTPSTLLNYENGFVESAMYYDRHVPEPLARALLHDPYMGLKRKTDVIPLFRLPSAPPLTVRDAAHVQTSDKTPIIIPQPWFYASPEWLLSPELRGRGRKPVGQKTRIDYRHPAANGLIVCHLFDDLRNLATGEPARYFTGKPTKAHKIERNQFIADESQPTNTGLWLDDIAQRLMAWGTENFLIVIRAQLKERVNEDSALLVTGFLGADARLALYYDQDNDRLVFEGDAGNDVATLDKVIDHSKFYTFAAFREGDRISVSIDGESGTDEIAAVGSYAELGQGLIAHGPFFLDSPEAVFDYAFIWRGVQKPEALLDSVLEDPFQFFKPVVSLPVFPVSPPQFYADDAAHIHTADKVSLSQEHRLGVVDSVHLQTSDLVPLIPAPALGVRDAVHLQVADQISLEEVHAFGVADTVHEHVVDTIPTTFKHIFRAKDSVHDHRTDHVNFEIVYLLNGLSTVHLHTVDQSAIEQRHGFGVLDSVHVHTSDTVDLSTLHVLGVQDAVHVQVSSAPPLAQVHVLGTADAIHEHVSDATVYYQAGVLIVGDAQHHQFSDFVGFAQVHVLGVDSAVHVQTSDEVPLAQVHTIGIEEAVHLQTSDEVPLAEEHQIGVSGTVHTQVAEATPVDQTHALGARDAVHLHESGLVDLSEAHDVTIADSVHVHTADQVSTSQRHSTAALDSVHLQTSDGVDLFQAHQLGILGSVHEQASDEVPLSQVHALFTEDSVHLHASDALRLYPVGVLVVGGAVHVQKSDFVGFAQKHQVGVDSAVHVQAADTVPTVQKYSLATEDSVHVHASRHVDFETVHRLSVAGTAHEHISETVELTSFKQLVVGDADHIHVAGAAELIQKHLLGVADSIHPHYADTVPGKVPPVFTKAPGERTYAIEADPRVLQVVEFIQQCH